ncbi:MAG: aspartate kinase [Bacteroidales bacterium]|jgi:aspartate kinase|nr:aspartate kinase [Bacteroidales bacterium]
MEIKVFKFGGTSVQHAAGIRNLTTILRKYTVNQIIVVVSAMGKTTNALEEVLKHYMQKDIIALIEAFEKVQKYHLTILDELFPDKDHVVFKEVDSLFNQLRGYIRRGHLFIPHAGDYDYNYNYDFEYDQIVSYGELFSSAIIHNYLVDQGLNVTFIDVRDLIKTDKSYRDARVDWEVTSTLIRQSVPGYFSNQDKPGKIILTQGFIGSDLNGNTTTLGREGSDFTAAIFAYSLNVNEMTIWKDVPGVMNADPKWMKDAVKLDTLSYREAIELAYYGARVIHPKTIKPLENANIILRVKSFLDPDGEGTTVQNLTNWTISVPIFIRKQNQVLISLSSRDFSFIMEENLSQIFKILATYRVKVNVMQHSAISFSFCVDADLQKIPLLLNHFQKEYQTRYNEGVELITIRHYQPDVVEKLIRNRNVLMEQKSRITLQLVLTQM